MTQAERFQAAFERQERDDRGMYIRPPSRFPLPEGVSLVSTDDQGNSQSSSPSWDATEVWEFSDGSQLIVANPRQGAFAAFFTVITPAEVISSLREENRGLKRRLEGALAAIKRHS